MQSFLVLGRTLLISVLDTLFLLWILPGVAREVGYARDACYAMGCLLIGVGSGYTFVRNSTSEECWRHAAILGAVIYFAIVTLVSAHARAVVLPVPLMFVLSGFSFGGLIRWNQLQKETRPDSVSSPADSDATTEKG
jgi:hypothetical protein